MIIKSFKMLKCFHLISQTRFDLSLHSCMPCSVFLGVRCVCVLQCSSVDVNFTNEYILFSTFP